MAEVSNGTKMTQKRYDELTERLNYLKMEARQEVSRRIGEARSFGDISENAEYDSAKDEQALIEGEIIELDNQLRNAQIISENDKDTSVVKMGFTVRVQNLTKGGTKDYIILGSSEVDIFSNPVKISNEGPLGKALLGKKVGEKLTVTLPKGETSQLKIIKIIGME